MFYLLQGVSQQPPRKKNRCISASEPFEKLYDGANESYLATVFAHINDQVVIELKTTIPMQFLTKKSKILEYIRGQSKKVVFDLGHIEKCGFLHGVQYVSNMTF